MKFDKVLIIKKHNKIAANWNRTKLVEYFSFFCLVAVNFFELITRWRRVVMSSIEEVRVARISSLP